MSKKFSDPWVRTFTVGDPVRHKKGYTLYKVTSKVFPKNSIEAVTQVTVWKRYNDFKKLHKTLSTLHQSLYLKGTFPTFAKARFFGRFDDTVIEERRQCALELLEFTAKHPPLFTSQVFVKFFEVTVLCLKGGQVVDPTEELEGEECVHSVLQPISLPFPSGTTEASSSNEEANATLGGIWKHRQAADEISVDSHATEDEDDDRTTFTDDNPSKSAISDLSEFDPLVEAGSSKSEDLCHDWLLSAFQSFGTPMPEKNENESLLTFPRPFSDLDDLDIPSEIQSHCVIPQNVPSSEIQDFHSIYNVGKNVCESNNSNVASTSNPQEFFSSSYIHVAAKSVAAAKEAELSEHFFNAFTCYKDAIDTLLLGVKGEQNTDQQEAVQKKILQYLRRAEEIYETHLMEFKKCQKPVVAPSESEAHSHESHVGIRRSMKDLAKYRVIGILSKVLLVLDVVTNITCIVKVLRKSPEPQEPCAPNIAPRSIDFMVQLYEMYETNDAIFLILEYASGGRLWDYISSYLQRSPLSPNNEYNSHTVNQEPKVDLNNVYSGKKIHTNNNNDISETMPLNDGSSVNEIEAMEIYPSSYAALFRNYAANISANSVSLAKCSLKKIPVPPDFQDVESSKDTLCFRSIDNMAEALDYIDDVQNSAELGTGEGNHHSGKEILQDPFKKNGFSSDLRTSFNSINAQSNSSNALLQNLHEAFVSPECSNIQSTETTIANTDLPTFLCENVGKAFMNQKEHGSYLNGEKKSSMLEIDTCDIRCWPKPGFTEVFHQMDVELSLASSKPTFLPESCIVLWAAEIVVALENLHKLGIIWKDLRPENVLLGTEGHILLSYQSQWNSVDSVINDKAIRNFYAAPEVSNIFGVTPSCDYWSLGAILFELLTGRRLVSCYPSGITAHTTIKVPDGVSSTAEDLLQKLLKHEPSERLGSGDQSLLEVKQHPFFHSVNWKSLRNF